MAVKTYRFVPQWSVPQDDLRQIGLTFDAEEALSEGIVETAFDALWDDLKAWYTLQIVLVGYKWYEGPTATSTGWEWGDTFRVTPRSVAGTDPFTTNMLPPQVAVVVSFPMPMDVRRHRGRVYMPNPSEARGTQEGRFAGPSAFADAFKTFFDTCSAAGWRPVVLAKVNGLSANFRIDTVRVNDVFDTQRRRGYEQALESQSRTVVHP